MPTLIDKLTGFGFSPQQPLLERKVIAVKENGKEHRIALTPKKRCAAYQVDGTIITKGSKCDKLVTVELEADKWAEIFVELKGKNITHAIEQLEATIQNDLFKHSTVTNKRARIVGQSIPRNTGNSVMERAKIRFKKLYKCDLRAFSSTPNEIL